MSLRPSMIAACVSATLLAGCGLPGRVLDLGGILPPRPEIVEEVPAGEPALVAPAGLKGSLAVDGGAVLAPLPPPMADGPYTLDTGDKLRIFVYGQPNLSRLYTVDHSGNVSFPLIGNVRARGATTTSLERVIAARLATNYVKDPQVTVDVQQNRPFFILGEVRSAGQYPYVSGLTVEAAVAIAGGFLERAREDHFRLTRRTNGLVEIMEVPGDFPIRPGDTIYVRERFF